MNSDLILGRFDKATIIAFGCSILLILLGAIVKPDFPSYDCAGYYGPTCTTILPEWRHTLRVNWRMPWVDATLSGAWRHWGEATFENLSSDPGMAGDPDPLLNDVDAVDYFDLSALWNMTDAVRMRAGVSNVFDEDPPLIPNYIVGGGLPNTYPMYDLLGRRFFAGVTLRF